MTALETILKDIQNVKVIDKSIDYDQYIPLDLSIQNENFTKQTIETAKPAIGIVQEAFKLYGNSQVALEENIASPILLGNRKRIQSLIQEYNIGLPDVPIIDPHIPASPEEAEKCREYARQFYEKRKRKGSTLPESEDIIKSRSYYGAMMVEMGDADAMVGGLSKKYTYTVKPALQIIGAREGVRKVAGMHIVITRQGPLFLADTTINHFLNAQDIADITELVAEEVEALNIQPRIALLTYSNFGSVPKGESAVMMREATAILHQRHPDWIVDGEMQAHMALNPEIRQQFFPFSKLGDQRANVLIFPNLSAANIAYNLLNHASKMDIIGPILLGLKKPVHVLQLGATVRQIVDIAGLAAYHARKS